MTYAKTSKTGNARITTSSKPNDTYLLAQGFLPTTLEAEDRCQEASKMDKRYTYRGCLIRKDTFRFEVVGTVGDCASGEYPARFKTLKAAKEYIDRHVGVEAGSLIIPQAMR